MDKVFIFDVDGTLTPPRQIMTDNFFKFFDEWSESNRFWLVSGSDLEKIKEQIPEKIYQKADGIFPCSGNQLYIDDNLMYERIFNPPQDLFDYLQRIVDSDDYYKFKTSNHIVNRKSMINFSVVGRDCTLEERRKYFKWDQEHNERNIIAREIKETWPQIDAVIGGQISIDILKRGFDKSQVIDVIKDKLNGIDIEEYIFIGDRTMDGGNDYPLAKVMDKLENCKVYQAGIPSQEDGYKETQKILESLID
tara:strand:- start:52 stop:801 length:750 start_codon:yes stop_codon:yes gene_type:complete